MKNNSKYFSIVAGLLIAACFATVAFFACKRAQNDDPASTAIPRSDISTNNSKEAAFLIKAAELSLREIELAKLAQSNGGSVNIKEMAKRVQEDHVEFLKEIRKLAELRSISIPDELPVTTSETTRKLIGKEGNNFNNEYCDLMLEGQKEAIAIYKSASERLKDPAVKNWAGKALPVLRDHLDFAITCKEVYKGDT